MLDRPSDLESPLGLLRAHAMRLADAMDKRQDEERNHVEHATQCHPCHDLLDDLDALHRKARKWKRRAKRAEKPRPRFAFTAQITPQEDPNA